MRGLRRGTDTGAAAVEFAIIAPVLFLLLMGMLEFSFLMRDTLAVAASVKAGARIASTQAGAGDAVCPNPKPDPSYVCAPANQSPALVTAAANAIQDAGSAMPRDYVDFIWVYKANASGWPGTATDVGAAAAQCPGTNCVKFTWNKAADRFQYTGGSWDSRTIDACLMTGTGPTKTLNPNMASVGVFMQATHPFFTKMFGVSIPIQNRVALKFDPLEARSCNGNGIGHGGHQ